MEKPTPLPVERALKRVGENLSRARRRRKMSQAMLAERIGVSLATLRRMEDGTGMTLLSLAKALHVFGELGKLDELLDAGQDSIGLTLMDEALPQRVRKPRRTPDSGAF